MRNYERDIESVLFVLNSMGDQYERLQQNSTGGGEEFELKAKGAIHMAWELGIIDSYESKWLEEQAEEIRSYPKHVFTEPDMPSPENEYNGCGHDLTNYHDCE